MFDWNLIIAALIGAAPTTLFICWEWHKARKLLAAEKTKAKTEATAKAERSKRRRRRK